MIADGGEVEEGKGKIWIVREGNTLYVGGGEGGGEVDETS